MNTLASTAGTVTEHTWVETRKGHGKKAEPIVTERTYRLAHLRADCQKAKSGVLVGMTDDVLAEWPCSVCIPTAMLGTGSDVIVDSVEHDVTAPSYPEGGSESEHHATPVDRNAPSPKQVDYWSSLVRDVATLTGKTFDVDALAEKMRAEGQWTREGLSAAIERGIAKAKALRAEQREHGPTPLVHLADVPAGRYAIPSKGTNDLVFYKIDRPTEGKWAGRLFVKMVVGGHDDTRVARDRVPAVLGSIVEFGTDRAAALYGQQIGKCSHCARSLTDKVSRFTGHGPTCREKLGIVVSDETRKAADRMAVEQGWNFDAEGDVK